MVHGLFDFLTKVFLFKIPLVFGYTSTKMMLALMTSFLISLLLGPWFIRQLHALKVGQNIRKEECPPLGKLHEKKQDTPTMGGVLILFSLVTSLFLWMDLTQGFTLILLIVTLLLAVLGGIDDFLKLKYRNSRGVSGKVKLLFQLLVSLFVAFSMYYPLNTPPIVKEEGKIQKTLTQVEYASRVYVPFIKGPIAYLPPFLATLFILFVITGASNAVNLTDGLDGLAAGSLIMVASTFAFIAFVSNHVELARYLNILYIEGSGEIAIYMSAFVGACLGFLWYNAHPAEVFMGDIGSLSLGGILGTAAVLLKREFLLAIVGGVFVVEALSVILQVASYKLRNKKRVFLCAPLHHHFEYKGWKETKVVIRFWIVGFILAIIGLLSLKFQ
jgi:phospho-N-acetylmuramoyl-pentapeptide-transferase